MPVARRAAGKAATRRRRPASEPELWKLVAAVSEPCARMFVQINEATTRLHAAVKRIGGVRVPAGRSSVEPLERRGLLSSSAGSLPGQDLSDNTDAAAAVTVEMLAVTAQPSITSTSPANGATGVARDAFVSANLSVTNGGIDVTTLTADTVKLYRTSDGAAVAASVNTSAGGDVLVLSPSAVLDPDTEYTFEVTAGLKDLSGVSFVSFVTRFRTGLTTNAGDSDIKFQKVGLNVPKAAYTSVTKGPDGRLYAGVETGEIYRFDIRPDGTLTNATLIASIVNANGGPRLLTGIEFDPQSNANDLALWVTHSYYAIDNGPDWTGKVTRLSGPDLTIVQDVVVGLPRSTRDHVTNQPKFGPDGALYFVQPGNTAMGAPDSAWHYRPERLLSGAVLRLDVGRAFDHIAAGKGPVDVKTEDGGSYNPYGSGAPLTIYATGIRNAFDLVWHSNGSLYAPTNGSQLGGATPAGPGVPGIPFVDQVEDDVLHNIFKGAYYGHPNPVRGQYVRNGGNPTDLADPFEIPQYPVGTKPALNYTGPFYNFGQHYSPNGVIEYRSGAFGGALQGKILVVQYSGGDNVVAITLNEHGHVVGAQSGFDGLKNFNDPVDLIEDRATGFIYVAEFGGQRLTLAKPLTTGAPAGDPAPTKRTPLAPYQLGVAVAGRDALELSWADSIGENGYRIERSTDGTSWTEIATTGPNETRYVDPSLVRGATYTYRVRSLNAIGVSKPSPVLAGTAPTVMLPAGWTGADVGASSRGTADLIDGAIQVIASGSGIGGTADGFFLASQSLAGDVEVVARLTALDPGNPTATAGVMIRGGAGADAPHAYLGLTNGGIKFQSRIATGAATQDVTPEAIPATTPAWVRLVRRGTQVSAYVATDGVNWRRVGLLNIALGDPVLVGLAASSGDVSRSSNAAFDNVIVGPASPLAVPESPAELAAIVDGTRVLLNWRDTAIDESGFDIHRRKAGADNWVRVGHVGPEATGYIDDNLAASKKYEYRVVAVNAAGESASADVAQAKTSKSIVKGQVPFGGVPAPVSGMIEAESFDDGAKGKSWKDRTPDNDYGVYRDAGVEIQETTDPDGGQFHVVASKGEWVEYTVDAPAAGTYTIELRLAAPAGYGGAASVAIDGKKATVGGSFALPATGGWDVWQTAAGVINLKAGVQVLRLCVDAADNPSGDVAAINWFKLTPTDVPTVASLSPATAKAALKPGPVAQRIFDAVFNDDTTIQAA